MSILVLILLLLFVVTSFVVVWVIIDNKSLRGKVGNAKEDTNSMKLAKGKSEDRLIKAFDSTIHDLTERNKELYRNNMTLKEKISDFIDEVKEKDDLIKQMRSVSISERAFLIDLED